MKLKYTNKLQNGEYEINIRGIIGFEVSGKAIAEEIEYLDSQGATKIIENINSAGGDIVDGFNIVSANLKAKAIIETVNIGVAGSMASIILASGDIRIALDYSTALVHDPQIGDETLEEIEDENKKSNLQKIKDSLVKILQDACKKSKNTISKLMTRETVMTAEEQKEFGLVDKIVKSRVKGIETKNLTLTELMNKYNELQTSNYTKSYHMDELTNFLGLNKEASQESILKAVKALKTQLDESSNSVVNLTDKLAQAEQDLQLTKDMLKTFEDQQIKNAVNAAITSGKFTEDKRATLEQQARANLEVFNAMIEAIPAPAKKSVLGEIKNQGKTTKTEDIKDWDYYQKNDPKFLQNLELTDLATYVDLYEAYWGEKYEPAKN